MHTDPRRACRRKLRAIASAENFHIASVQQRWCRVANQRVVDADAKTSDGNGPMRIEFDFDLGDEEKTRLASTLGCQPDEVEERLSKYGRAATREYVNGFLGNWTATRAADLQEYRLLALMLEVFGGIPDEDVVVRHFSITPTQARSLIRSVLSKYPYELSGLLKAALSQAVQDCVQQGENGTYEVVIKNSTVVEELNRRLTAINGRLTQIGKKRGSVSVYQATASSYEALCADLGVPVRRHGDE